MTRKLCPYGQDKRTNAQKQRVFPTSLLRFYFDYEYGILRLIYVRFGDALLQPVILRFYSYYCATNLCTFWRRSPATGNIRGWERVPSRWYGMSTRHWVLGFSTSRLQNRED